MMRSTWRVMLAGLALVAAVPAGAKKAAKAGTDWIAEEQPLPLAVKTADDLRLKAMAERQYLIFNLLGRGKVAWDKGDFAEAANRWEELLKLPEVDPRLAAELKPFAQSARKRAGGALPDVPAVENVTSTPSEPVAESKPDAEKKPEKAATVTVSGTVSGGEGGPGGAVVTLRRADGKTPKARPSRGKVMQQKEKSFLPHVMVVPAGSSVSFKNMDPVFHNVFSLSPARKFDTGFFKSGASESVRFDNPGVVEVLCNIHPNMLAYVVVVDTPYHAIANATGQFTIKNVPPGEYLVEVWHESASVIGKDKITVGEEPAKVALTVGADKRRNPFPPDKYGKPRQSQLGY